MTNLNLTTLEPKRSPIRTRWSRVLAVFAALIFTGPTTAQGVLTGATDGFLPDDGAIRVVTEFDEAVASAHCSPVRACYIELERGEQLAHHAYFGDTTRWHEIYSRWWVRTMPYGQEPETVVLEVRPEADAEDMTLAIPTARRLYVIALVNDPDMHTPVLRFRWADGEAP